VILKDLIALLQRQSVVQWRLIVEKLAAYYLENGQEDISKSYINDVLRVARRGSVIDVANGGSLAQAAVKLSIGGDRLFQESVILCDVTYLKEISALSDPIDMNEAAKALYDDVGHARYLSLILNRYSSDGNTAN
jgi:hypothetical protein